MPRTPVAAQIHPSHAVEHDGNTIVRGRFGATWECISCGYGAWENVAGQDVDPELEAPCYFDKEGGDAPTTEWLLWRHERAFKELERMTQLLRERGVVPDAY